MRDDRTKPLWQQMWGAINLLEAARNGNTDSVLGASCQEAIEVLQKAQAALRHATREPTEADVERVAETMFLDTNQHQPNYQWKDAEEVTRKTYRSNARTAIREWTEG